MENSEENMHFHIRGKRINRRIHKFSYLFTVLALVTKQTKHIVKQITPHILIFPPDLSRMVVFLIS